MVRESRRWAAVGMCALAALTCGCSQPSIKVDGSSTVIRITEAVTEEFAQGAAGCSRDGGRSGTGGGFKKFANGEIDICDASRPIKDDREEGLREDTASNTSSLEIAFDGLSLVVESARTIGAIA